MDPKWLAFITPHKPTCVPCVLMVNDRARSDKAAAEHMEYGCKQDQDIAGINIGREWGWCRGL